jgi:ferredoxin-thioredoxin reductase catalytic subunit
MLTHRERIKKDIENVAAKKGWIVNPESVEQIVDGLHRNQVKYERRVCPCQFYPNGIISKADICPCENFRATGNCHCDLYKVEKP